VLLLAVMLAAGGFGEIVLGPTLRSLGTPLGTRILAWLGRDGLSILGTLVLGAVICLIGIWAFRAMVSRTRLGYWVPAWGRLQKSRDLSIMCTTLAMGVEGGRPLGDSIDAAASAVPNRYARRRTRMLRMRTDEGDALSTALFYDRYFPRTLSWAVSLGEAQEDVGGVLGLFANIYSTELERECETLVMVLGPLGVLVLGNVVLFVALMNVGAWFSDILGLGL
jgi:type II secretory pathway component PulF